MLYLLSLILPPPSLISRPSPLRPQAQLRVNVVGGGSPVTVTLQSPMDYQLAAGAAALVVGNLDGAARITDAVCSSTPADIPVETPFNEDLFKRAINAYNRFPQMFKASPP